MQRQGVEFRDLGQMDYKAAWEYQDVLMKENLEIKAFSNQTTPAPEPGQQPTKHYLLFVEHPPVYTLGKSGNIGNVLINEGEREKRGIQFFHTNRGGDITFHGPGQVVGYPHL